MIDCDRFSVLFIAVRFLFWHCRIVVKMLQFLLLQKKKKNQVAMCVPEISVQVIVWRDKIFESFGYSVVCVRYF